MSNIEAIIVDGVRYDKVRAKTEFVCEECELRDKICDNSWSLFSLYCNEFSSHKECWKRKEE